MTTYDRAGVSQKLGDDASKVLYEAAKLTWENRKGKLGRLLKPSGLGAMIDNPFQPCDLMLQLDLS